MLEYAELLNICSSDEKSDVEIKFFSFHFSLFIYLLTFASANHKCALNGEMAEWSIASVLKTDVLKGTGGSNPSLSASEGSPKGFLLCFLRGTLTPGGVLSSSPRRHPAGCRADTSRKAKVLNNWNLNLP